MMLDARRFPSTFKLGSAVLLLSFLSMGALTGGCGKSEQSGSNSATHFDPGKEEEQKKIADQHAATLAKERAFMMQNMPAGTPTGPPPDKAGQK